MPSTLKIKRLRELLGDDGEMPVTLKIKKLRALYGSSTDPSNFLCRATEPSCKELETFEDFHTKIKRLRELLGDDGEMPVTLKIKKLRALYGSSTDPSNFLCRGTEPSCKELETFEDFHTKIKRLRELLGDDGEMPVTLKIKKLRALYGSSTDPSNFLCRDTEPSCKELETFEDFHTKIKRLRELLGDDGEMPVTLKIKKLRALYGSSTDPSNFLSRATEPSCKELETFEDFHTKIKRLRELLGDDGEMPVTLKIKKLRALYGSSTDPSNFLCRATKPSCKELETFEDFHTKIKRLRELLGDDGEMPVTLKIKKLRALYGSSTDPSNFLSRATEPSCKELETFEDFHITVEGICINSNLSEETRKKYYQLCCSQNSLLHDRLTTDFCGEGENAAIIIETVVIIADSIKACDLNHVKEGDLREKALKCIQIFGMKVGFLLHRLSQLVKIANESKRCLNDIEDIKAFHSELLRFSDEKGAQIQRLKSKSVENRRKFEELVNAPW